MPEARISRMREGPTFLSLVVRAGGTNCRAGSRGEVEAEVEVMGMSWLR